MVGWIEMFIILVKGTFMMLILPNILLLIGSSESQLTKNPSWYIQEAG